MKTRERLKAIKNETKFFKRLRLAEDYAPSTKFDALFEDAAQAWFFSHRLKPNGDVLRAVKCPRVKEWSKEHHSTELSAENGLRYEAMAEALSSEIGRRIINACVRGDSQFFFELAEALVKWTQHKPFPDTLRVQLLRQIPSGYEFSMREIIKRLRKAGFDVNDNTERRVRTLAPQLGITISGKSGRPKTGKP